MVNCLHVVMTYCRLLGYTESLLDKVGYNDSRKESAFTSTKTALFTLAKIYIDRCCCTLIYTRDNI